MAQVLEKILLQRLDNTQLKLRLGLRWAAISLGVAMIIWLPIEDVNLNAVVSFSVLILVWGASNFLIGKDSELNVRIFGWTGVLIGVAVGPLAVLLILIKGGLHSHGFLDFSLGQITRLLYTIPLWGIGGLFVGLFMGLMYRRYQT